MLNPDVRFSRLTWKAAILLGICAVLAACQGPETQPEPVRTTRDPITVPAPSVPAPSPTAEPTALPTPTAPPPTATTAPPKTLFLESFDDDITCFRIRSLDPGIELSLKDEAYHIRVSGDNWFTSQCRGGYRDFVLEYDVTLAEGSLHSIVGLMFRLYVGSSYNVYLSGSNEFCWDHYDFDADRFRELAGCWVRLPHQFDIARTLRVRIVAYQDQMAVYLNEEAVAVAYDDSLDYGTFGFFVGNAGAGATEAVIDNIVIREIRPPDLEIFRGSQTGL